MDKLTFLVYSKSPETRTSIVEQLLTTDQVVVNATFTDLNSMSEALRLRRVDGIYLDLDEEPDETLASVASLAEPRPTILLGARDSDAGLLLSAMRIGAKDFFIDHRLTGVQKSLQSAQPMRQHSERAAPTLAIVGAKGGVGATTIACELGVSLQETGLRTIVCDLSRRLGDVALYFDLRPRYDMSDIVRREGELDAVFVDAVVAKHESQVSVLAAPTKLEDVTQLKSAKLDRVLKLLQDEYDVIILDVPWDFDEFSLRALDMSNEILIITNADVTSLTHARTRRQMIERFGALPERVHVVLNRASAEQSLAEKQVVEFLERDLDATIPDQPEVARKCTDEGVILRDLKEGRIMREAIVELRDRACEWCDLELPEQAEPTSRRKLIQKLRKAIRRN